MLASSLMFSYSLYQHCTNVKQDESGCKPPRLNIILFRIHASCNWCVCVYGIIRGVQEIT